ncbi:MAG: hypothetical protein A2939_03965 [Parcubacteria group bacterium RIFCSPLOWO2_01_FULL_48_18]|nr:MAG: hypothetical protein A2939_03965 [Parcubacteria group bacterium RIFCSPLOWO2_01_FULL_48_18]OHB23319.1 MAG: hypothetical protein A3J67_06035 [Parcubacteria group bacterium RIFCSPHIGHO2_02_FULL_48_10b]
MKVRNYLGIIAVFAVIGAGLARCANWASGEALATLEHLQQENDAERQLRGITAIAGKGFQLSREAGNSWQEILTRVDEAEYFESEIFRYANRRSDRITIVRNEAGAWIKLSWKDRPFKILSEDIPAILTLVNGIRPALLITHYPVHEFESPIREDDGGIVKLKLSLKTDAIEFIYGSTTGGHGVTFVRGSSAAKPVVDKLRFAFEKLAEIEDRESSQTDASASAR